MASLENTIKDSSDGRLESIKRDYGVDDATAQKILDESKKEGKGFKSAFESTTGEKKPRPENPKLKDAIAAEPLNEMDAGRLKSIKEEYAVDEATAKKILDKARTGKRGFGAAYYDVTGKSARPSKLEPLNEMDTSRVASIKKEYGVDDTIAKRIFEKAKAEKKGFASAYNAVTGKTKPRPEDPRKVKAEEPGLKEAITTPQTEEAKPEVEESSVRSRIDDKKKVTKALNLTKKENKESPVSQVELALNNLDAALGTEDTKYATALKDIALRIEAKEKKIEDAEGRKAILQLISGLSNALTQYGAARYGMKHGVDMSGLKMATPNIEASMKGQFARLERGLDKLDKEKLGLASASDKKKASILKLKDKLLANEAEKEKILQAQGFQSSEAEKARAHQLAATKASRAEERRAKPTNKERGEANDWIRNGRPAYGEDKTKVDNALRDIQSGAAATGGLLGQVPQEIRLMYSNITGDKEVAKGVQAELGVVSVLKKSMREILGGQFAEREGRELIKSMFNAGLSKPQVIEQIKIIQTRLTASAQAKEAYAKHVMSGGTIFDYEGPSSVETFYKGQPGGIPDVSMEKVPGKKEEAPKEGAGETRRETKDGVAIFDSKTKEFLRWEEE